MGSCLRDHTKKTPCLRTILAKNRHIVIAGDWNAAWFFTVFVTI